MSDATRWFVAGLLFLSLTVWLSPAQEPAKKPPRKEEEEEAVKPKPKVPLRVDDEPGPRRPERAAAPLPADLAREAEQATHVAVRTLYKQLAVPHDVVSWTSGSGKTMKVEPVVRYIDTETELKSPIRLHPYEENPKGPWKRLPAFTVTRKEIKAIDPYEQIALRAVKRFLDPKATMLPRLDVLRTAERALAAVVRFHKSARERGLREGDEWNEPARLLRAELLAVQLEALAGLVEARDWDAAYADAARLAESYPRADVQARLAQHMARFVELALSEENYRAVHLRLRLLEDIFPKSNTSRPVSDSLARKAAELFARARVEAGKNNKAQAVALLTTAESIWPRLPGLRDYRLQLANDYPILHVGVRALPENLSPATACTEAERQALELLFEGLLHSSHDPDLGQRYEPGLAEELPKLVPLGREFHLAREAYWSDGTPVTAVDVRRTVQLLRERGAAPLLDEARPGADAFHVVVTLRQGFIDPLSLMTFKVLPAQLERLDDPRFARQPIGSGPFCFKSRDPDSVSFIANHNYRRPSALQSATTGPRIREIRFFVSKDPAADFAAGKLHLLLDLPTDAVARLQSVKKVALHTLPNRRVYFLAVNHRKTSLQNPDLRRAIALGIDRTTILNEVFRGPFKDEPQPPHRPLNGPYPPGSWACKPELKPDPYNPALAKLLAGKCKGAKLSLKYPGDESRVRQACEAIRDQLRELGIDIQPVPCPPAQLQREVENEHDYELAYAHHDYASEAYLLWPLFDPRALGRGGSNYLGYENDGDLQSWFHKALDHREFAEVRKFTHAIHGVLHDKMPLIPLWQLDTHLAMHADLMTVPQPRVLDALRIFRQIGRWELVRRP